jgi:glycerol-3-phosphate dehydrogenase (NAD(P)+)
MNISVLGAGGWGTALSILLNQNKHKVVLWEYYREYAETLAEYRENFYYLPKIRIPLSIRITNDLKYAVEKSDGLLITTPTQFIRKSLANLINFDLKNKFIICASKGIEQKTNLLVTDIIQDILGKRRSGNLAVLSGPSHAEEVSVRIPTAVVCASDNINLSKKIQKIFSNNYFRVYSSTDVKGVEIGGALKNIIAIASGIADGAKFGDNTKAAIMTRGMNEIMRFGLKMGAKMETFFGLSGIGDLIVTCSSKHSRNRYIGEQLGMGKNLKTVLNEMKMVAEGVMTTTAAYELAKLEKIDLPIVESVYQIIFEGRSPREATKLLMNRPLKKEHL